MCKFYLQLIKPGIVFSNLFSTIGGFLLASKGNINYNLFFFTLSGVLLVVASSCTFNNYIDRDIDKKMKRTSNRALAKELISSSTSIIYAILLGFSGFTLLWFGTNILAFFLGAAGFFIYVVIYSLYMKRRSIYSTLVGSFSGASPPIIGYCAVTNTFDSGACILLAMFSFWQMSHFYAISIFRFDDYQKAKIPSLSLIRGISVTKNYIIYYIIAFFIASLMLFVKGYTGYKYLVVTLVLSIWWLTLAISGYNKVLYSAIWARKLFLFSIVIIISLSIMMSIDFTIYNPHNL